MRWSGVAVSSSTVTLVDCEVPDERDAPLVVLADSTFQLQTGDRAGAYAVMYRQVQDHVKEAQTNRVILKASAVSLAGTKKAHLDAAELRGVVTAACADVCDVGVVAKSKLSRTFGSRKADEYIADDQFWEGAVAGGLRKGSREAALLLVAGRPQ